MPKKYVKKPYKKNKKVIRRTQKTINYRSGTLIAPRFVTRLKYAETVALSLTGGTVTDYQMRLNSLYDPNQTGTGHQPMGFDQYATFYNRYRVFGTSYRITVLPTGTNTGHICIVPNNSNTGLTTSIDDCREQPRSKIKSLALDVETVLAGKISLPSLGGVTTVQYRSDDRYQSVVSDNPVEHYGLHIGLLSFANITVNVRIEMIYHCEFFDPKTIAQS